MPHARAHPDLAADVIAGLIAPTGAADHPLRLRGLLGPYVDVYTIPPQGQAMLGRGASCEICLVHESVSRTHASIAARAGHWFVVDESSSAGTFLNGVRLTPGEPAPLGHGDLMRVGPWTFRVEVAPSADAVEAPGSSVRTLDDTGDPRQRIERVSTSVHGLAAQRFTILIECLSQLHSAAEERGMAQAALTYAIKGTGYPRGAVLTPGAAPGEVTVFATAGAHGPMPTFSRALLSEAAQGSAVTLGERGAPSTPSQSMAEMHVERAVCAPVMLGETLCAYLYLDARAEDLRGAAPAATTGAMRDAGPFCEAIARALGLAISNFRRTQLERRHVELVGELQAARAVQQTISPAPSGRVGHLAYAAHVEPGVYVAGDLFDVFEVHGAVAVCLGDVAGHGVGSGMLMASTQAHLNAHLCASGSASGGTLLRAVESLNAYLCDHAEAGRFVSLWVGLIAPDGTITYIDAGHGHWLIRRSHVDAGDAGHEGHVDAGDEGHVGVGVGVGVGGVGVGGVPVGVMPDSEYSLATARLNPGDRLILYSDGVVEQRDTHGREFGVARLHAALRGGTDPASDVGRVMEALAGLAPQGRFDDDATIASLRFEGGVGCGGVGGGGVGGGGVVGGGGGGGGK